MEQSKTVRRYDKGELRRAYRSPEGYLFVDAAVTRVGVFEYLQADGSIRRELRPPDEVMRADSLGTLGRKPVTLGHPDEPVTSENVGELGVGSAGEHVVCTEGGFVTVSLAIHRADAVVAVTEKRVQEVSCGYDCTLEYASGSWQGEPYDAIQRGIKYNHIAIVDRGRAGPQVRIRLDEGDAMLVDAVGAVPDYPIAERTRPWEGRLAEERWRRHVGAVRGEVPAEYAKAYLWHDPGLRDRFAGYKLQVVDLVNGEPHIIPRAVFAVAAVLEGARGGVDVPASDIPKLKARVADLYMRMRRAWEDPTIKAPWERGDEEAADMLENDEQQDVTEDANGDASEDAGKAPPMEEQGGEETGMDAKSSDQPEVEVELKGTPEEVEMMKGKLEKADKLIADLEAKLETMTKERDELKGKVDAMRASDACKKKDQDDASKRLDWFDERAELLGIAKVRGVSGDLRRLDNGELLRAIVAGHTKIDVSDVSDEYARGAFAVIKGELGTRSQHLDALASVFRVEPKAEKKDEKSSFSENMRAAEREYHERHDCAAYRKGE